MAAVLQRASFFSSKRQNPNNGRFPYTGTILTLHFFPLTHQNFFLTHHHQPLLQLTTTLLEIKTSLTMASTVNLPVIEATPTSFQEFGQVIEASPDGEGFGPNDAQLDLSRGTPRFYILHLEKRPLKFVHITHHANVTQCLGSIGGHDWYLGVAKASIVNSSEINNSDMDKKVVQSKSGHYYVPPVPDEVRVFRISGPKFIKLHVGTWHAGPLFKPETMDFYNLELTDTNVVDHTSHDFRKQDGVVFCFDD